MEPTLLSLLRDLAEARNDLARAKEASGNYGAQLFASSPEYRQLVTLKEKEVAAKEELDLADQKARAEALAIYLVEKNPKVLPCVMVKLFTTTVYDKDKMTGWAMEHAPMLLTINENAVDDTAKLLLSSPAYAATPPPLTLVETPKVYLDRDLSRYLPTPADPGLAPPSQPSAVAEEQSQVRHSAE